MQAAISPSASDMEGEEEGGKGPFPLQTLSRATARLRTCAAAGLSRATHTHTHTTTLPHLHCTRLHAPHTAPHASPFFPHGARPRTHAALPFIPSVWWFNHGYLCCYLRFWFGL